MNKGLWTRTEGIDYWCPLGKKGVELRVLGPFPSSIGLGLSLSFFFPLHINRF